MVKLTHLLRTRAYGWLTLEKNLLADLWENSGCGGIQVAKNSGLWNRDTFSANYSFLTNGWR